MSDDQQERFVPQDVRKTRVNVLVSGKIVRTYEGFNEEECLRDAQILKTELVASGKTEVAVKVLHSING